MEVSGKLHAPADLPPEKEPPAAVGCVLRPVWTTLRRKILPDRVSKSDPSAVHPVASQSLYRLSHHYGLHTSFEAHNAYDGSSPSEKYSQLRNEVFATVISHE
jgi:hypothetical protein